MFLRAAVVFVAGMVAALAFVLTRQQHHEQDMEPDNDWLGEWRPVTVNLNTSTWRPAEW